MKYAVILFDADETLFDFRKAEQEAFQNTLLEFASAADLNYHFQVYQEINEAIWKEFEEGRITQQALKVERFQRLSQRLNAGFDSAEFAQSYIRHLAQASFLYDDSAPLIKSLHRNYRLAIVTNGLKDVQNQRIRNSSIGEYFELIVISEEVTLSKPDPRIFAYALNQLQHSDKRRVLMVGDGLTSDIQGGINSGIDTCWFNPRRIANKTGIKPTYQIARLPELLDILENTDQILVRPCC